MTQGNMLSPTVKLNSGHDMPLVGFGCWKVNNDTCADQIYNAIKAGYRLFDGACGMYASLTSPSSFSFSSSCRRGMACGKSAPQPR